MNDATNTNNDNTGGVALLDDTEIDPEVAAVAGEAARKQLRKARMARRHDIDFEPRDTPE